MNTYLKQIVNSNDLTKEELDIHNKIEEYYKQIFGNEWTAAYEMFLKGQRLFGEENVQVFNKEEQVVYKLIQDSEGYVRFISKFKKERNTNRYLLIGAIIAIIISNFYF